MSNIGFLIAAYAITIAGLAGYYFLLRRQQAQVAEDLRAAEHPEFTDAG